MLYNFNNLPPIPEDSLSKELKKYQLSLYYRRLHPLSDLRFRHAVRKGGRALHSP